MERRPSISRQSLKFVTQVHWNSHLSLHFTALSYDSCCVNSELVATFYVYDAILQIHAQIFYTKVEGIAAKFAICHKGK